MTMAKLSRFALAAILAAAVNSHPAVAEELSSGLQHCSAIGDDASRLACFDSLAGAARPAKAEARSDYHEIDLADLKVDKASMIGQRVKVRGQIQVMGDIALLKSDAMDMTPLFFDYRKLPREQRKALLNNCTMPCDATVSGTVRSQPLGVTLSGDQADFN